MMDKKVFMTMVGLFAIALFFGIFIGVSAHVQFEPVPVCQVVNFDNIPTQTPHVCPALPPPCPTVLYKILPDPDHEGENLRLAILSIDLALEQLEAIMSMKGVYHEPPHAQAIVAINYLNNARMWVGETSTSIYGWKVQGQLTCPQ